MSSHAYDVLKRELKKLNRHQRKAKYLVEVLKKKNTVVSLAKISILQRLIAKRKTKITNTRKAIKILGA